MSITPVKNEIVLLKINNKVVEKIFSHWLSNNNNGTVFYTTDGCKHKISELI
jgi:hypothetical protein